MGALASCIREVLPTNPKGSASMDPSVRERAVRCLAMYLAWMFVPSVFCQTVLSSNQSSPPACQANGATAAQVTPSGHLPTRIFGIIPNYRSYPSLKDSKPLAAGKKFKLAARDSFDPGTFLLAGTFAGIGQASNSTPSYGQGIAG